MGKLSALEQFAIPLELDIVTNQLRVSGFGAQPRQANLRSATATSQIAAEAGVLFWGMKLGDRRPVAVLLTRAGAPIAVSPTSLTLGIKELEPERLIALNDGTFVSRTRDGVTRHLIEIYLDPDDLGSILSDYEADAGTALLMPVELQATFDPDTAVEEDQQQATPSLSGGFDEDYTFNIDLSELSGAADFRVSVDLAVPQIGPAGWAAQSIAKTSDFEITPGTPFTEDFTDGALDGQGAAPSSPHQWRAALATTVTGTNTGIDVAVSVTAGAVGFQEARFTMPRRYIVSSTSNPAYTFGSHGGGYPNGHLLLRNEGSTVDTLYFAYDFYASYPYFSSCTKLGAAIQQALSLGYTPEVRAYSATEIGIFFQTGDPGIDEIRIQEVATGSTTYEVLAPVDYPLISYPNGFTAASELVVTVEQLGGESADPDYVITSQTAVLELERDMVPTPA